MKTAERAHTPAKLWERIKLSKQYSRALEQIDERLIYWPGFLKHKCKQRLTRLTQVMLRERRYVMREEERHYATKSNKVKRREKVRERKALVAAKLEKAIEKELLDRLKSGAYGDAPLNVDEKIFQKVMNTVEEEEGEKEQEKEEEEEDEEEYEEEDEEDYSDVGEVEFVEDDEDDMVEMEELERWLADSDEDKHQPSDSDSSESEESDSEDNSGSEDEGGKGKTKRKQPEGPKKRPRVEIEYEQERERVRA